MLPLAIFLTNSWLILLTSVTISMAAALKTAAVLP
jgi:hypothetical protein